MAVRGLIARIVQSGCALALALAVAMPVYAQSGDISEGDIPPSGPPSAAIHKAIPAPAASPAAAAPLKPAPRPRSTIPYTIRPGDSMGSIAQMFGLTPDELARTNRLSPDEELMAGDVLKVPNPFTAQVKSLQAQVDTLNAEAQTAEQKAEAAQRDLSASQDKVSDLTSDNQSLNSSLRLLPWWRASALSAAFAAALMFGVMVVTLFEWWRMRRRYVTLANLADDLGRLDYKYKSMLAKAELRLQQLYGRRRGGLTEGQPRPKMPEEVEIERLSEELRQILEHHLVRMGARPRSARKRARWREMLGGVDSPAEISSSSSRR